MGSVDNGNNTRPAVKPRAILHCTVRHTAVALGVRVVVRWEKVGVLACGKCVYASRAPHTHTTDAVPCVALSTMPFRRAQRGWQASPSSV